LFLAVNSFRFLTHYQSDSCVHLGIFKPAYLVTLSEAITDEPGGTPPVSPPISKSSDTPVFIEESSIDIYKVGQNFSVAPDQTANWVVNVSLALRSASNFLNPSITLSIPALNLMSDALPVAPIKNTAISATWVGVTWQIPDDVPERWYPHNLGQPKLYNLTVTLHLSEMLHEKSVSFTTTTGFRTIQLVQSPYSQEDVDARGITPGDQWHFEINGKTFYAKGTNIIPFDPFYARTKPEAVKWVLESAVKSGQNMVSPSGIPLNDLIVSILHYPAPNMGRRNIPTIGFFHCWRIV
jgi:beta-mannosidase